MKLWTTAVAALFALLMTAMTGSASADVGNWHPQNWQPAVMQEAIAPQPLTTIAYYHHRRWRCANPHFRHHHWWLCH